MTTILDDKTSRHGQGLDRVRLIRGLGPVDRVFRTTIHLDTSYLFQSRAKIEMWNAGTPSGWTEVYSSPGEALPVIRRSPASIAGEATLDAIVRRFEELAAQIVS